MKNLLTIIAILICYNSYSQTILNGSFENDSIYMKGEVLSQFWSLGQDLTSFYELIDYVDNVFPLAHTPLKINIHLDTNTHLLGYDVFLNNYVPDGHYALMLKSDIHASTGTEWRSGISLELSEPLIDGHTYNIRFYKCKQYFNEKWPVNQVFPAKIKIGLSNDKYVFGDLIHTAQEASSIYWEIDSFNFTAPFAAEYITVQGLAPGVGRFNVQADDFVLTHLSGPLPDLNSINDHIDNYTNSVADDLHSNLEYTISPNPSSGEFYINFNEGGALPKHIEIFNQLGQRVFETILTQSENKISLNHLSQGVYYLVGEGLKPEKIVISHD
ncbi:MAG: hypothetical protein COA49_02660 [Bacteroidetes bacterium]|nr:MAG: hypothetical protein COA49_02660 [Bacteroidota bacterium]